MSNFYRHLATFIWSHCSRLKFDANTERRFIRSLSLYIPPLSLSLSLSLSFYLSLILPLTHSLSSLACYTIPTFVSLSLTLFPIVSLFLFSLFLSLSLSHTHTHFLFPSGPPSTSFSQRKAFFHSSLLAGTASHTKPLQLTAKLSRSAGWRKVVFNSTTL